MSCNQIQVELSAYLDGEATTLPREQIEAHVETCADCRQALSELRQLSRGLAALPRLQPSPAFLARVRQRIGGETVGAAARSRVDWLWRPVWLKVPLEAVAVVTVLATAVILLRIVTPPPREDTKSDVAPASQPGRRARIEVAEKGLDSTEGTALKLKDDLEVLGDKRKSGDALLGQRGERLRAAGGAGVAGPTEPPPAAAPAPQPPARGASEELKRADENAQPAGELMAKARAPQPVFDQPAEAYFGLDADRVQQLAVAEKPAETIVVESVDSAAVRQQAEQVAARLGGTVTTVAFATNGRSASRFWVELPADNVWEFKERFLMVSVHRPTMAKELAERENDALKQAQAEARLREDVGQIPSSSITGTEEPVHAAPFTSPKKLELGRAKASSDELNYTMATPLASAPAPEARSSAAQAAATATRDEAEEAAQAARAVLEIQVIPR